MKNGNTRGRRDDNDTPFGHWLRNHPELRSGSGYDCEDIDGIGKLYIWHQYKQIYDEYGYLMIIEEKQNNADRSFPQQDTQSVIDQALRFAFDHPDFSVERLASGRPTKIRYSGYHLIQFEHTSPVDGYIRIDKKLATKDELLRFLKFERMRRRDNTSRLRSLLDEISEALAAQDEWEERDRYGA